MIGLVFKIVKYFWAGPNSLIGLSVGLLGLLTGGKCEIQQGCLEFHGGFVTWALERLQGGVLAMTLGHTIIGRTQSGLAVVRKHEQVHVRQYERWGPFFIPAYLLCSLILWMRGRDYYRENPFEVEAYRISDPAN